MSEVVKQIKTGGKRTQWIGILTIVGSILNIVIKVLNGGDVNIEDIAVVLGGATAYTVGEKIDRGSGNAQ